MMDKKVLRKVTCILCIVLLHPLWTLPAISITHFIPVSLPVISASDDNATENPVLIQNYYPTVSGGSTIKVLYRISGAAIDDSAGHTSRIISLYINGNLHSRFPTEHYTPRLAGNSFSHWQLLDITLPDTSGECKVALTARDHIAGDEVESSFLCYLESVNTEDGTTGSIVSADQEEPESMDISVNTVGITDPYTLTTEQRGLGTVLRQFGLRDASFSLRQNIVRIHYSEDITEQDPAELLEPPSSTNEVTDENPGSGSIPELSGEAEPAEYCELLGKLITAMVFGSTMYPDSEAVAVFPEVHGIPIIRIWAGTTEIMDFAAGNISFNTFYHNYLHADFSVYQAVVPRDSIDWSVPPAVSVPDAGEEFSTDLFENFNDNTYGWLEDEEISVADGVYRFSSVSEGRTAFFYEPLEKGVISVNTEKISGADEAGYGLLFHVRDSQNFFYFLIGGPGYYSVGYALRGKYTQVIPWTRSEALSLDGPNKLTVEVDGNTAAGSVNGTALFSIGTGVLNNGKLGLFASPDQTVNFDNISIHSPFPDLTDYPGPVISHVDGISLYTYDPDLFQFSSTYSIGAAGSGSFPGLSSFGTISQDEIDSLYLFCLNSRLLWQELFNANIENRQKMRLEQFYDERGSSPEMPVNGIMDWIETYLPQADIRQVSSTVNKLHSTTSSMEDERAAARILNWGIILVDKEGCASPILLGTDAVSGALAKLAANYAYQVQASGNARFNFSRNRLMIVDIIKSDTR